MIEKAYKTTQGDEKVIEVVIKDEYVHYNHMTLPAGESLPIHKTNAKSVYMFVVRGILTITLEEGEPSVYEKGTILRLPEGVLMHARNEHSEVLELTVVKTPAPR